ncbi:LPD7 domain-containing protein, partial [Pseudomonas fluorescens]|uniref:LPD7 domain-containing protein n=1 Tax=Pseudomonas fluorescens TaxID=294 RepID=UPI001242AE1D
MIIRYGGGNDGIKDYLENGRKVDRHFSRDELDRRVPIEGDLNVTQAVIDSMENSGQERYLHITMSFNEEDIDEESMSTVFQQYRKELMSAFSEDEYSMYAEIHWPKIKEAYNHQTEQMEKRYPHVHIVLPKKNLLTGGFLDPCSIHQRSVKYFDAIQEKLNRDNRLSSPRDSPRIGTNHYESALGRYKDKEFGSKNGELKREIFNQINARNVRTTNSFAELLGEFGEVRVRNKGKENEYFAVKVAGDKKFTNLKANIFDKRYIVDRALGLEPLTDSQVIRRVESWRSIRSKEIKHISNSSAKVKSEYKALTLPQRRQFLLDRESYFEQRYRGSKEGGLGKVRRGRLGKTELPGLSQRDHQSGDLEFARRPEAERARYLHELHQSSLDNLDSQPAAADRLLLLGDEVGHVQHLQEDRSAGLRDNLYVGAGGRRQLVDDTDPQSSVLGSLLAVEEQEVQKAADLKKFAEIRKRMDAQHLLAFAQIKYGVNPDDHPVSRARDGSPRIKVGKFNYNVSDFLTKHIGLDWSEASQVLTQLYEKQQQGLVERPKSKVAHISDWRRFRDEVYPNNLKTYDALKNEIRVSFALGMKAINSEYFSRRRNITEDSSLTRTDKHYMRSVVILEKLQKVEALQLRVKQQNVISTKVKYPYSNLFYDFATKNEVFDVKYLDDLKRRLRPSIADGAENSIGPVAAPTVIHLPTGAEAAKRARLAASLKQQEREGKELKIRISDLRPSPLPTGEVAFRHKDHGKQIFVNHPDRVELNRVTEQDEVAVGMIYAIERFGSPLAINGTPEFRAQVIQVAAEWDMDITFTDESMNKALQEKRAELGMSPLQGNEITVADLELDATLPKEQAVDKAMLASRVAEMAQVGKMAILNPPSAADVQILDAVVADARSRHEEIDSGFVDDDRAAEIAAADVLAWRQLESTPQLAVFAASVSTVMTNEAYSAHMIAHGPKELQLTLDAAKVYGEQNDVQRAESLANAATPAPAPVQQQEQQPVELDLTAMQAGLDRSKANAELADAANEQQRAEFWNNGTASTV